MAVRRSTRRPNENRLLPQTDGSSSLGYQTLSVRLNSQRAHDATGIPDRAAVCCDSGCSGRESVGRVRSIAPQSFEEYADVSSLPAGRGAASTGLDSSSWRKPMTRNNSNFARSCQPQLPPEMFKSLNDSVSELARDLQGHPSRAGWGITRESSLPYVWSYVLGGDQYPRRDGLPWTWTKARSARWRPCVCWAAGRSAGGRIRQWTTTAQADRVRGDAHTRAQRHQPRRSGVEQHR